MIKSELIESSLFFDIYNMNNHVMSFDKFFESVEDEFDKFLHLYVNIKLYPKKILDFSKTYQRELIDKVDPFTKRLTQFVNLYNRKDTKANIVKFWDKFKVGKPSLEHVSGEDIKQYLEYDQKAKTLLLKHSFKEKYLEYFFEIENKIIKESEQ